MRNHRRAARSVSVGVVGICTVALSACASNNDSATPAANSSSGTTSSSATGTQPDVSGDGKVVIGVLSPGDLNDHGYYQSFVDQADSFAKANGWSVIKRGNVNPADALNAARALCQQHVDLVALGAQELKDAIPAAAEPVCAKTNWYMPSAGGPGVSVSPKVALSTDDINEDLLAAGYAAGVLMAPKGSTKAGFVTGPEADFAKLAVSAFRAGVRLVIPKATVVATYTGDFNDSAKAKVATQAQMSQGVSAIYPYLGGATDASAKLANTKNLIVLTPGTDRCAETSPKFAISVIFSPGAYFESALKSFAAGTLEMGKTKVWHMGVDAYPTVKFCSATPGQNAKLKQFIADVGSKKIDPAAEVAKLGGK